MKPGTIVIIKLPQRDGRQKSRPALVLGKHATSNTEILFCGISTQLHEYREKYDDIISFQDTDYELSGLADTSVIRLDYLSFLPKENIRRTIGSISKERLDRLNIRLEKMYDERKNS
jgi:mRNA interferase MazF